MPNIIAQTIEVIRDLPAVIKSLALILSVTIEYIFPIFPGDTIVLFAGFLNAREALELFDILCAILVGTLLGASIAYWFGRWLDRHKHKFRKLAGVLKSEGYRKFGRWYKKWGIWFLLFNRFFPGVRALFFVVAGAEKISFAQVMVFGGLSAVLYNACLIGLGLFLGFNAELVVHYFYRYNAVALVLLVVVIIAFMVFAWRATRKK